MKIKKDNRNEEAVVRARKLLQWLQLPDKNSFDISRHNCDFFYI